MFEYGEGTNAHRSCGATFFGQMWVFGGADDYKRQVFDTLHQLQK